MLPLAVRLAIAAQRNTCVCGQIELRSTAELKTERIRAHTQSHAVLKHTGCSATPNELINLRREIQITQGLLGACGAPTACTLAKPVAPPQP